MILTLILLNILAVMLETVEAIYVAYSYFFRSFEVFSVVIFTIEYILRLWVCTNYKEFVHPIIGRLKYALTPMALVDLVSILPFYLPAFIPVDMRFMRVIRLFRLFRMLKLERYYGALGTILGVIKEKKEDLLVTVSFLLVLLIVASSLMYFIESSVQPNTFSSIPAAMWWAIVTLTTVGYGDIYPVTTLGKFLGAIIALLGVGLFALPAGIVASGFVERIYRRREKKRVTCHCVKGIEL